MKSTNLLVMYAHTYAYLLIGIRMQTANLALYLALADDRSEAMLL